MRSKSINHILFLLPVLLFISFISYGQRDTTLTQEVEVVKSYNPSISDANKINDMPGVQEKQQEKPTFNYSIFSQPIYNTFSVNTLKAASFAGEPDRDTGYGLVKAGFGNYYKPYGEVFFNSQNIKNTIFGLHGMHLSSHGKVKLDGGNRVKAPFSDNQAEMFLKHLSRNSILSINLGFNHNGFNYYGYPVDSIPAILRNENQDINYFGKRQTFTKGSLNLNLENTSAGRNDFKYNFNFLYHYFGTKTNQKEHLGELTADIKKPMETGLGMLEAGITYVKSSNIFNRTLLDTTSNQQIWLVAKPGYRFGGDVINIRLGIDAWFVLEDEADTKAKLAPDIRVNFIPVKEILTLFAGVDGNYINNHYSRIAYENPFIDPFHDVKNTFEKLRAYGGIDGKFASKTNFKVSAEYALINYQPFYYQYEYTYPVIGPMPDPSVIDNDFDVVYDNIDRIKFNMEVFHTSSQKLDLLLKANYYKYKMQSLDEPWHLPDWDATFSVGYHINEQLHVSTDIYLIGARKALIVESTGFDNRPHDYYAITELENVRYKSYKLKQVADFNFNANYKITDKFSAFAQLHNFGFQKYERWFGYPVQSFNFLAGISYTF